MIRMAPFVSAMERLCRENLRYEVYLGEVTVERPPTPYVLVKLPPINMGSGECLDGELRELSYLQPITMVAATADRLLTVVDDVRRGLEGQQLQTGSNYCEPLRLEYCSGLLRDDQVAIPEVGHPFYGVDMWRVRAVRHFH
jgi:hypothetical protein